MQDAGRMHGPGRPRVQRIGPPTVWLTHADDDPEFHRVSGERFAIAAPPASLNR